MKNGDAIFKQPPFKPFPRMEYRTNLDVDELKEIIIWIGEYDFLRLDVDYPPIGMVILK